MQDKGVGVFAELPLWPLDLWGGDLRGPRGVDSKRFSPDFGAAKWVRMVLGRPLGTGCRIRISRVKRQRSASVATLVETPSQNEARVIGDLEWWCQENATLGELSPAPRRATRAIWSHCALRKDPRCAECWHGPRPASWSPTSGSGNTARSHRCGIRKAEATLVRVVRSRCGAAFVDTDGRNGRLRLLCRVPRSRRGRARAEARLRVLGSCPNVLTSFLKRVFCIARDRIRLTTDGFAINHYRLKPVV